MKYELGVYIPEDDILRVLSVFVAETDSTSDM
jgi:hypothetical protein